VSLVGNKEAQGAALNRSIFKKLLSSVDFQILARPLLLLDQQKMWNFADTGKFIYHISRGFSLALV
jgi:hypothetical protein